LSSIAKLFLLSSAKQIQHRLRTGAGSGPEHAKKDFHAQGKEIWARGRKPASPAKKKRFQVIARVRMTAHQVSPGSPASRSSWMGQKGAHPHRDQ
jgi:hypothetical protein